MMELNEHSLKLSKQLCFPLYACARETIKLYTPHLDALGLTYTQYITMMVLWEQKSLTAKELGRILHLDSGTLTPLLKKLEAKGLLTRRRSESDERNLVVTLSPEGEALKQRAEHIPSAMIQGITLDKEERRQLFHLLNKLLDNLDSEK